jgi:chromosome partitioning protein
MGPVLQRLDAAIKTVADQFDIIVLDCGPNLGILTYNATVAANVFMIPIKPDMSAFGSCVSYTGSLEQLFQSYPKKFDYFRCLINQHPGGEDAAQAEKMIRLNFKDHVLKNVMVTTQELQRSTNDLGTLYEIKKPKRSIQTYRRALKHMDLVNEEILELVRATWE